MRIAYLAIILAACFPTRSGRCADVTRDAADGIFRGHLVSYRAVGAAKVFQGDILLDHVTARPVQDHGAGPQSFGVAYTHYLWPVGQSGTAEIPYVVTSGADQLNAAIAQFNTSFSGVIQFVARGTQADYVNFAFDAGNGSGQCESYVGRVGGEQNVGGSATCNRGTLLHEMGHVVGLWHEQSRPDRDNFVTIDTANVIKGSLDNFGIITDDAQTLGLYDYASVMQYIPFAFSRNGGPVMDSIPPGMPLSNAAGYTAADIDGIMRLYGSAPNAVTVTSNPPGLSIVVDGMSVTTPKTYGWAMNSMHTLAVGSSAQALSGSTYTYGRWNDNPAASHTIKISAGNNSLARPGTSPSVTVYTANFIQLSAYSGNIVPAGAGAITVSPQPLTYPGVSGTYFVARQKVTLTMTSTGSYHFVTLGGTSAPFSANPKPDYTPDGAGPYAVSAYFSQLPLTTITTTTGGFYFTVDGNYYKSPQSFTADLFGGWNKGSTHALTGFSPSEPYSLNSRFVFVSWSDHGTLSHSFTVPAGGKTITGTFTAQYVPIAYATPSCAATVTISPASPDGFYTAGTTVKIAAKPASGWRITGWTGDLSGKMANQTLVVNDEALAVAGYNTTGTPFAVTSLSPASFPAGSAGGTVKVKGTGFDSGSIVFVDNAYRVASFVNTKEVDVALTASDLTIAGAFPIGISNFPQNAPCSAYGSLGLSVLR